MPGGIKLTSVLFSFLFSSPFLSRLSFTTMSTPSNGPHSPERRNTYLNPTQDSPSISSNNRPPKTITQKPALSRSLLSRGQQPPSTVTGRPQPPSIETSTEAPRIPHYTLDPWDTFSPIIAIVLPEHQDLWIVADDLDNTGTITLHDTFHNKINKNLDQNHPNLLRIKAIYQWKAYNYVLTPEIPTSTIAMALMVTSGDIKQNMCVFILIRVLGVIKLLWQQDIAFVPTDDDIYLHEGSILIGRNFAAFA